MLRKDIEKFVNINKKIKELREKRNNTLALSSTDLKKYDEEINQLRKESDELFEEIKHSDKKRNYSILKR